MATSDTIKAVQMFVDAFNKRDAEALMAICHPRVLYTLDDNYPTHTPAYVRTAIEATFKRAGPQAFYTCATHDDEPIAILWAPDKKTRQAAPIRVTNFNAFGGKIRLITDSTNPAKLARVKGDPPAELLPKEPKPATETWSEGA